MKYLLYFKKRRNDKEKIINMKEAVTEKVRLIDEIYKKVNKTNRTSRVLLIERFVPKK